jgi:hypothetical protein
MAKKENKVMNVTHPEDLRYLVPQIWSGGKRRPKKKKGK